MSEEAPLGQGVCRECGEAVGKPHRDNCSFYKMPAIRVRPRRVGRFVWSDIPQQPQRQDSLTDQLNDLYLAAVKLGLYDAADYIAGHKPGTAKTRNEGA